MIVQWPPGTLRRVTCGLLVAWVQDGAHATAYPRTVARVLDEVVARGSRGDRSAPAAAGFWTDLLTRANHPLATDLPDENLSSTARGLGREIHRLRMSQGLSQRELARLVGLSAHSNVCDYERGVSIPPDDLIPAFERALLIRHGHLEWLYHRALAERADRADTRNGGRHAGLRVRGSPSEPARLPRTGPVHRAHHRRVAQLDPAHRLRDPGRPLRRQTHPRSTPAGPGRYSLPTRACRGHGASASSSWAQSSSCATGHAQAVQTPHSTRNQPESKPSGGALLIHDLLSQQQALITRRHTRAPNHHAHLFTAEQSARGTWCTDWTCQNRACL
ncbi:helix-turn-helix domain-containing protein [Leekyejoonella antrihumi]|uniref:Helix-turn-helix transcriptional regulator n=1 Tax=Leekyejoonella antrihumi TaxID=1660198 RepID=A0A563E3V1_9MICO|nr:helix-turn-helix transcriptional regulator [Leekyejoonella antrihumi]